MGFPKNIAAGELKRSGPCPVNGASQERLADTHNGEFLMTIFSTRTFAALIAAAGMAMAAPLASAQEPQPQQPPAAQPPAEQPPAQTPGFDQPAPDAAQVGEEDLQRFALAAIEVQRVNQTFAPQLQQAQSPDEQQQIRQQANQAAAQAVQEVGLTVEQYNDISRLAVQNPQVAEQVNSYIEEALPQQMQEPAQPQQ
jgi:hypothetical protein